MADDGLAAGLPLIDGGVDGVPRMMGNPLRVIGEYFGNARPAP